MSSSRTLISLADAVGPARAQHAGLLAEFAAWSMARGRTADPDVVALVVAAAHDRFAREDGPCGVVTRPGINDFLSSRVGNWCSFNRVLIPDGVPEALWLLLHFLSETDRLPEGADALPRLLEPLQCYGGLDADGRATPEGALPDFPCQCYLPVVAPSRPGLSRWRTVRGLVIELWQPNRSEPALVSWYEALCRYSRGLRDDDWPWIVHLEDFRFVGRIDPTKWAPALSLYAHREDRGELLLDADGAPYELIEDRRRKLGYRTETLDLSAAAWRAGIPRRQIEEEARHNRNPFGDDDPLDPVGSYDPDAPYGRDDPDGASDDRTIVDLASRRGRRRPSA